MTNPDQEPKSDVTGKPGPADAAGIRTSGAVAPSGADAVPTSSATDQSAPGDDHLLGAVLSSEAIANIDSTLDQLTSATDLFDVPAFDLDA